MTGLAHSRPAYAGLTPAVVHEDPPVTPSKTTPDAEQPATPSTPSPGTMSALVLDAAAKYTGTALKYPLGKGWGEISYPKLGTGVREIAKGLIALGIEPG